jgi:hypothetical protein
MADAQTVFVSQPQPTQPQASMPSQPSTQPAWNTPQPYSLQPQKKSSKTWVWVLLILGAIVLLCGGGGLILVVVGLQNTGSEPSNVAVNATNKSANSTPANVDTSGRTEFDSINLSKWVPSSSIYADVEYTDGELLVKNKEKKYYYVLAGTKDQKSVDADSRVTVRNVDNADTNLGYGIVFHSNPTPLQQGYAFIIDAKKKRYRVVHHTPSDEDAVVDWSRSDAILDGTQGNTLEVRDKTDKIDLYINGKLVNSIKNVYGYPGGVIGIYSSGALKIAFRDLQIRR